MTQRDTPWGAEEIALNTDVYIEQNHSNLVVKKAMLDAEELTAVERHKNANVIIYVLSGAVDLKVGSEFYELEDGEAHFVEANTPHQIENLDDSVTSVLRIMFPFDPDDVEVLEDPYT